MSKQVCVVTPGGFQSAKHYYPRVPNAMLHPLVRSFLALGNERIAERYCHLHPEVSPAGIRRVLSTMPQHLRWAGADLVLTTDERGYRRVVVLEVNSCPSGQKSLPLLDVDDELGGYRRLLERSFMPLLRKRHRLRPGPVAVLWDKNPMETSGYAAALADLLDEEVLWVHVPADDPDPAMRVVEGDIEVRTTQGWVKLAAAFRYVTQRPWTRIPPMTRTEVFNPVVACLAGGRNKLLAAQAYQLANSQLEREGLHIRTPETAWDVKLEDIPRIVHRFGGVAVVKNPYSNAGQGIWTIVNDHELDAFMDTPHRYDRFIVQALIGNTSWSSTSRDGRLYHVGTVPSRKGHIYATDVRFMVGGGQKGFYPIGLYARRARTPLERAIADHSCSWAMLGTNLSVKLPDGSFTTEPERLLLMDSRDFNALGMGLDDLIEGYIQTVLSVLAIDQMAQRLLTQKGRFRRRVFHSLDRDEALLAEVMT